MNNLVFKVGTLLTFGRQGAWRVVGYEELEGTPVYILKSVLHDSADHRGDKFKIDQEIYRTDTIERSALILAAGKI